jgi:hypothetical protein
VRSVGKEAIVRLRRHHLSGLSEQERRVLNAFSCGHLTAGQLSEALAAARRSTTVPAPVVAAAAVHEPAVEPGRLQLAA